MILIKHNKIYGANQYEVRDSDGVYVGWLYRAYHPWIGLSGKTPNYDWILDVHEDYHKLDHLLNIWVGLEFDNFKEAKKWLEENVE